MKHRQVYVIHRKDPNNIGDIASAPTTYLQQFPWLRNATIIDIESDIRKYSSSLRSANVILGGGGLLGTQFFEEQLKLLLELRPRKLIAWGIGHNAHGISQIKEPGYLKSFDLVGLRDYGQDNFEWVPCPSAFIPYLDDPPSPKHKIVLYHHWKHPIPRYEDQKNYPELTNNSANLEKTIKFLSSGETIITSSYHGAYWATLLGRRVVVSNPFSSKFYGLRHKVPLVQDGDWHKAIKFSHVYTNALMECRSTNMAFSERVKTLLSL